MSAHDQKIALLMGEVTKGLEIAIDLLKELRNLTSEQAQAQFELKISQQRLEKELIYLYKIVKEGNGKPALVDQVNELTKKIEKQEGLDSKVMSLTKKIATWETVFWRSAKIGFGIAGAGITSLCVAGKKIILEILQRILQP